MRISDFLAPGSVDLDLAGDDKAEALDALVALLGLDDRSRRALSRAVRRREKLGSTGIGRGVAIPHCRSLAVNRLGLAYGGHRAGVDFGAVDGRPVRHLFLIVAPPVEVSVQYLPVLGRIAQFARAPDVPAKLAAIQSPEALFGLFDRKGV